MTRLAGSGSPVAESTRKAVRAIRERSPPRGRGRALDRPGSRDLGAPDPGGQGDRIGTAASLRAPQGRHDAGGARSAPRVYIHLVPINTVHDLDFAQAEADPDPDDLDLAADTVRQGLQDMGATTVVD